MSFQSTKRYGHEQGISAAFRQWRAVHSHCRFVHGYALAFKFVFAADTLDDHNWVQDFGSLKGLKAEIAIAFDHRLLVANDDPYRDVLLELEHAGIASVHLVEATGCEAFAKMAYHMAELCVLRQGSRVRVVSCECSEHDGNSAIYIGETQP